MDILTYSGVAEAAKARGHVVVIDVLRAFTVEACMFENGLEACLLTDSRDQALEWKKRGLGSITLGEVSGLTFEETGFDLGNSPRDVLNLDLAGKTVIHRTSCGTSSICAAAPRADKIYGCSFLTALSTVQDTLADGAQTVSLIASGARGPKRHDEDEVCAIYLRSLLEGATPDPDSVVALARGTRRYRKFAARAPEGDAEHDGEIAMRINRCDFAIVVRTETIGPGETALVARAVHTPKASS